MKSPVKVAVTGAAGQIGYSLLFRIASGSMLGPDQPIELRLIEIPSALKALEGVVMELADCAFPLITSMIPTTDLDEGFRGINWALLVGSVPRKQGMERKELLGINGKIFTGQGRAIEKNAASDVRVLVVGNPCNTNCLIAMNNAPSVPKDRFFAMTTLDELRARTQLAKKAGVDVSEVSQMIIWGNHSATQFPDFHHAKIGGRAAREAINDDEWLHGKFISTVQNSGTQVIQARLASSAASAAHATVTGVYRLVHDTPKDEYYSVGRFSNGEYGVDPGLIFSFPSITENGVSRIVEGLELNDHARKMIAVTAEELRKERDLCVELGLIPSEATIKAV